MNTVDAIKAALAPLDPIVIDIEDESDKHAGHAGNSGGGHYTILIVSDSFVGLPAIKRHRLVFKLVDELMQKHIHALSINAKTTSEYQLV